MAATRFGISTRLLLVAAALGAGAVAVAGCHHDANQDADEQTKLDAPPPREELKWKSEPLEGVAGGVAAPVPVKEGPAPLVYMTEQEQVVQVIDRTNNKVLGQATVPSRTLVRVDERLGVIAGKQALFAGQLEKDHRYAIVIVPQGTAVVRTGHYQPVEPQQLEPKGSAAAEAPAPDTGSNPASNAGTSETK